jgi:hypothetical protein
MGELLEDRALLVQLLHTHRSSVMLHAATSDQVPETATEIAVVHGVDDRI